MSQYVSGNMSQQMSHEYGEFIQIGKLRVRRSLVQAYLVPDNWGKKTPDSNEVVYGILVYFGTWQGASFESEEELHKKVAELDWLFKKEYARQNKE